MPEHPSARHGLVRWCRNTADGLSVFVRDVGNGMLEVSHNLLALVGLAALAAVVFVAGHSEIRKAVEVRALGWLNDRHLPLMDSGKPDSAPTPVVAQAREAAPKIDLDKLPKAQLAVTQWLSRRYSVAAEPVAELVHEAWLQGKKVSLEPTLILAIMAIESSFNPFAQSNVGAQGLMQVMTRVHDDKFAAFGGNGAAFDPVANLRVGVQILKDCIARAGSVEGGLKHYVGAANLPDDGGYGVRVLAEQAHLLQVASGKAVPHNAPRNVAAFMPAATPPLATADASRVTGGRLAQGQPVEPTAAVPLPKPSVPKHPVVGAAEPTPGGTHPTAEGSPTVLSDLPLKGQPVMLPTVGAQPAPAAPAGLGPVSDAAGLDVRSPVSPSARLAGL